MSGKYWTSDRRVYVDGTGTRVVEATDPDVGTMLAVPGTVLPMEKAQALGLVDPQAAPEAATASVSDLGFTRASSVTQLKGIGPSAAKKLNKLGVNTVGDLMELDDATLMEQLRWGPSHVLEVREQLAALEGAETTAAAPEAETAAEPAAETPEAADADDAEEDDDGADNPG